jgi:hypothetical protein
MKSRRAPQNEVPAIIEMGDSRSFIRIPIDDCPILLILPIFMPPAVLDDRPYQLGIQGTGNFFMSEAREIAKEKLRKKHGGPGKIKFNIRYQPTNFARMLA